MDNIEEVRDLAFECGNGPWLFCRPGVRTSRKLFPVKHGVLFVASEPQLLTIIGPAGRDYDVYLCTHGGHIYPVHTESYETLNGALYRARREQRDWSDEGFHRIERRYGT